jgi:hypothetical protein
MNQFLLVRKLLAAALFMMLAPGAFAQEAAAPQEFRYNGAAKRDPFKPIAIAAPTLQTLSQLQSFNLNELQLVGTLMGNEMSALIMTPKKEGIIARVGDKVGNTGGRIVLIGNSHIVVREPLIDSVDGGASAGGRRPRFNDVTLPLAQRKNDVGLSSKNQTAGSRPKPDGTFPEFNSNMSSPPLSNNTTLGIP